jgi:hypothetical protein
VILLLAALGLGYKLRADWKRTAQRQDVLLAGAAPTAPSAAGLPAAPQPATGSELIVANNLFFSDRNNQLPKAVEKKPPPPQPILIGTINLGRTKVALMAEANQPAAMPRQVKEGESFAGYTLVTIGNNQVILEWEGAKQTVDVSLAPVQVGAPAYTPPAAASAPSVSSTASASVTTVPSAPPPPDTAKIIPGKQGPGDEINSGFSRLAYPGDPLPAGTIINGFIKVERLSPFGKEMWWQRVDQPQQPKKDERKPQ